MKRFALYLGLATALVASCSTQEKDFQTPVQDDVVFYASFEQPAEDGTRVYANEDLLLRWTADDRISIFNRNTFNQQYRFTGETGDNAGGFDKVAGSEFATGNAISHVVSVYPYQSTTKISESESLTLTLPAEQHYAENSFGLGANTMVSVTEDNFLQYKTIGGYLRLRLYGDGVSVSSITLKGNNGEKLAGKATVTMPLDGTPAVTLAEDATDQITLVCDTPVALGATVEEGKDFWLVVPPVSFSKGFTVTVSGNGGVFEKSTEKTVTIERNKLSKMAPIEVEFTPTQPRDVIYYTSSDGNVVTPYNPDVFGASILSNEYVDGLGIITFDGDVTSIGDSAFALCEKLASITIPEGVMSIGNWVFMECSNLISITLPESVTSIGNYAFVSCTSLTTITIPNGVTCIGEASFSMCSSLTSITIPDSVTSIGDNAFSSCSSLTSITIPESVTSIGNDAFSCTGLTALIIPKSVTSIGNYAFSSCRSLNTITIPDSVTNIGNYAFSGCTSLTTITIPDSVTSLVGAFYDCTSLTTITIPGSMTSISPDIFHGCTSLLSISIPESVTSIGNNAFAECSSLTMITIPEGVTSIEAAAFYKCIGLLNITIPKNVSSIGSYAFNGCTNLTSITIKPEVPPTGEMRMFDDTNNAPIYVPVGSVELYKSATFWSDYADRIYAIGTPMAVDLGLSVKWASWNLGATAPEEYGDYYAWGETEPYYSCLDPLTWKEGKKAGYDWASYKWCMGSYNSLTKYCCWSAYGYNRFTDEKTVLGQEDDAAYFNLGGGWRIPTKAEWTELRENCSWTWTTQGGVAGYKVSSKKTGYTDQSIFLPAAGQLSGLYLNGVGYYGYYWSSSLDTADGPHGAWIMNFESRLIFYNGMQRCAGISIRPVCY